MLQRTFEFAVSDHGNDTTASWPSFVDDDTFSVSYEGLGTTLQEGQYWGIWIVSFTKAEKVLRIEVGNSSVERFEAGEYVDGSFRDVSDLVASYFNLNEYNYQLRLQNSAGYLVRDALGIRPIELNQDPEK